MRNAAAKLVLCHGSPGLGATAALCAAVNKQEHCCKRRSSGTPTSHSALRTPHFRFGFTLAELMVAIGLLGVGLVMVGTAFPAALMENKESYEKMMAQTIAENAAAICRARLRHAVVDGDPNVAARMTDIGNIASSEMPASDRCYPIGTDPNLATYGWLLAAYQPSGDGVNDYILYIVPYRKFKPADAPVWVSYIPGAVNKVPLARAYLYAPVINTKNLYYAYVRDSTAGNLTTTLLTLDGWLSVGPTAGAASWAIGCYPVRMSLQP